MCYTDIIRLNRTFVKIKNEKHETFREYNMYILYKTERNNSYKTAKITR